MSAAEIKTYKNEKGKFFDNWDYAWKVKKTLKAESFVIKLDDKKIKSGLDKYKCNFIGNDELGMETLVSKHDALQKTIALAVKHISLS